MKIKWGALVVDGRGKIGGHVASKNRGGAYLRTKVTPVNPSSFAQSVVRTIFGAISTTWSSLTAAQIASWNNAVSDFATTDIFGDLKKPSGKNLHQKLNQNLLLVGESALTTVPAKLALPDEVTDIVDFIIGDAEIVPNGANTDAGVFLVLSSSGPITNGTSNAKNKLRVIYTVQASSYSAPNAYAQHVERFGTPVAGQKIQFGLEYVVASGQKSVRQIIDSVVSAT